jgi:hypothetical protein
VLLVTAPAVALADGDPASDVLAAQTLYLPGDGGIPPAEQAKLVSLVRSAQRQGFPIRAALIATPSDLGSVSELWRMPGSYARFLGQELGLVFRGTLLVAMPNGFGIYRAGGVTPAQRSSIARLPAPGGAASLGAAAVGAVQRLAAASGHRLTLPPVTAAPATGTSSVFGGPFAWLGWAVGVALIALAWTASLRARPARPARSADSQG